MRGTHRLPGSCREITQPARIRTARPLLPQSVMEIVSAHRNEPLPDVHAALGKLLQLVEMCDVEAALSGVPERYSALMQRDFDAFVHLFDRVARQLPHHDVLALGAHVQHRMLPLLARSANAHRWYSKPRGYAGDFVTIARIYEDRAEGSGAVGELIDRCMLDVPAARAVQNRRSLLASEIRAEVMRIGGTTRIASLACGPARELFDLAGTLRHSIVATLVDLDADALAYCATQKLREAEVLLVRANLIHAGLGRQALALREQDLIYSLGLFDYLGDGMVVKVLDLIHGALRSGGRVIAGNFHARNATKAFMDHVLDWRLVHRTEADMRRLFQASAFGQCTRISYEPLRINMFAEGIKA